ncbi:MAG: toll/interleukin-1 receptor domain-containing protein [Pseudomonadota bacterium]
MRPVYIIAAPEDEADAQAIAEDLKRLGVISRIETGRFGFPPARPNEVTLAFWSQKATMSPKRLMLTNRAIDALIEDALILCQLDSGFLPTGLRDVAAIDLSFASQRPFKAQEIAAKIRAVQPKPIPPPPDEPGEEDGFAGPAAGAREPAFDLDREHDYELPDKTTARAGNRIWPLFGVVLALAAAGLALGLRRFEWSAIPTPALALIGGGAALLIAAIGVIVWIVSSRRLAASVSLEEPGLAEPQPSASIDIGDVEGKIEAPFWGREDRDAVFVSYSSADKGAVWPLVDEVEQSGISVWIDREIGAGEGWAGAIVRAIKETGTFCLMCSPNAFNSDHVRREIYIADKYKKALLPVILEEAAMPDDIEYFLIDRQWVRLDACTEDERPARLREAIQALGPAS